jgi:U3 small nucleolar RNA-associated protein 10
LGLYINADILKLRRKTLMAIETRLTVDEAENKKATTALLGFVPRLTDLVNDSENLGLKHTAIECVDQIAEKYGKTDIETIKAASLIISGPAALSYPDEKIQVMSLLCLASVAEILQAQLVPLLPIALPSTLGHLENSVLENTENEKLHNAALAVLSAITHHVPWMITRQHLDTILQLCYKSAEVEFSDAADEGRLELLRFLPLKIDGKLLLEAISRNWVNAADAGTIVGCRGSVFQILCADMLQAMSENIKLLGDCIEKQPKSIIAKHSTLLGQILLKGFDLRRSQTLAGDAVFDQEDVQELEDDLNDVAIKMIYKLNDTTFRPMFVEIVEWVTKTLSKQDRIGRSSRVITLFIFLSKFFDTLKVSHPLCKN